MRSGAAQANGQGGSFSAKLRRWLLGADDRSDDPALRFARAYCRDHPTASRAELVMAVRRDLVGRERAQGGGVLDLGLLDELHWHEQAEWVVAKLAREQAGETASLLAVSA